MNLRQRLRRLEETRKEARELDRLGRTLDFTKLMDGELTELLGIRNGKAGKPASPKRTLQILRIAKERIEGGAVQVEEEEPTSRVATGRKPQRDE